MNPPWQDWMNWRPRCARPGQRSRLSQRCQQPDRGTDFHSDFTQQDFEDSVEKIREYVLAGDVMQTVLSRRMSVAFEAPPLNLYRALRCLNPSPYMYFLNLRDFHIVGSSPEILARVEDEEVTVRPWPGPASAAPPARRDRALEEELLADPKELAEHLMLIDLGRNDIGRVTETGSVKLTDKMTVERYSHVMHIVSNVTGRLKKGLSCMDVLRATPARRHPERRPQDPRHGDPGRTRAG